MKNLCLLFVVLFLLLSNPAFGQNVYVLDLRSVDHSYRIDDNVSNDLDVTGTYTIELWLYAESVNTDLDRILYRGDVFNLRFRTTATSDYNVEFYGTDGSGSDLLLSNDLNVGTWYHIAVCRSSGTARLFVNGTEHDNSTNVDLALQGTINSLSVGARWQSGSYSQFGEFAIDEFRISDNARYTSNFTITRDYASFTSDANTIVLFHYDDNSETPPDNSSGKTFTINNSPGGIVSGDYTAFDDASFNESLPLPVELTSFSAKVSEGEVTLKWQTATEVQNHGFNVERKTNKDRKRTWEKIGFVNGYGNSNSRKSYSFIDKDIAESGIYYYRLKQIDTDGNFTYSNELCVTIGKPMTFVIEQNYPNPFNPVTTIKYRIPELSFVTLKVYDVLGKDIATLVNGEKPAGTYDITWNAENFPSGVYFYRLQAGEFIKTKKMLLIK